MDEKQHFTTFDSVSVLALLSGVIILIAGIVTNAMIDQRFERAKNRAHQLAAQILVGGISHSSGKSMKNRQTKDDGETSKIDQSRGLASINPIEIDPVGRIGMDPWGSPYYYKISETEEGRRIIEVASAGEDRLLQTELGMKKRMGDDILAIETSH